MLISSEKKKDNVNVIFFLGVKWLEILYSIHVVGPNSPGQIWKEKFTIINFFTMSCYNYDMTERN